MRSGPVYFPHHPRVPARRRNLFLPQLLSLLCLPSLLLTSMNAWGSSGVVAAVQKKYVITETSTDHTQITKDGTTMDLKCAGVYSLPIGQMVSTSPDNTVADGKVKSPSTMVKFTLERLGAHVLQTGDKVYITKIEDKTDAKGDVLKFAILTTDALDVTGSDAKKKFSATVSFRFKKGYLDETPPEEVEQAIEAVLAPDTGSGQGQNDSASASQAPQAQQQAPPPPPQRAAAPPPAMAAAPAAPPPTIAIGESSTQVLQSLGMPMQMIDLGKKKTFVYKSMKVMFVDDKVSDVQ